MHVINILYASVAQEEFDGGTQAGNVRGDRDNRVAAVRTDDGDESP